MILRYSQWRDEQAKSKLKFDDLMRLFSQLLLQSNGDVSQALQWMTYLDNKYGFFDEVEGMSFEEFIEKLKEKGYIEEAQGIYILTTKGGRQLRQDSLKEIFTTLKKSPSGEHETPYTGQGIDRLSETKPYQFGDQPYNIDFTTTIGNAIRREGFDEIRLREEDFEVYETEHLTSCATVLLLDISHSMILYGEDRITPAKKVALALSELIQTRFPGDDLHVLVFGDDAKEVSVDAIPFIAVGPFYTNTKAALERARHLLMRKRNVNKQVFMITDGKPSAIFQNGRIYKNPFGLDRRIVNKTLDEAVLCRRQKITITTFMVARDPWLVDFVKKLTEANRGRAYYSSLNKLGEYVFVDYIRNRRRMVR